MHPYTRFERIGAKAFLRMPARALRAVVGPPLRSPEGYVLDLQTQGLLWLMRTTGEPEMHEGELSKIRRRFDRAARILEPPAAGAVGVHDGTIPGGAGPRPVRIYTPAAARRGLLPGLLWLHGGGFVLGSIESHHGMCRALAVQAGIVVVSLAYRLAPEHRFPAGVDDATAAARWLLEHGEAFGIDPNAVAIGGDSAGGNFAAVAAQHLRGGRRSPALQILVYPPTDARRRDPSHSHFREGFVLTGKNIGWFLDQYIPDSSYVENPGVSPLLAPDLSGLPEALVITAGFDPLRDEGRGYAERMQAAGVDVTYVCAESAMHGFIHTGGGIDESARLFSYVVNHLRRVLFRRPPAA
jgi:acetyl esterase